MMTEESTPSAETHANNNMDISGIADSIIQDAYNTNPTKKWVKLIRNQDSGLFDEYTHKNQFIHVAKIVIDVDIHTSGKYKDKKKRNTLIKFDPVISIAAFAENCEWIYIITINGRIVKLGGTRTGLKQRAASYLCGHHTTERGKSGDCSKTNGFVYNTLAFYLSHGCKIELYGFKLPINTLIITILNRIENIVVQTYHKYESIMLEDIRNTFSKYPVLNDNSDPEFKDKSVKQK